MNKDKVTEKVIAGKKIYIVENHHEVIIPWTEYANSTDIAPIVLTFDHHADTRSAFYRYGCETAGQDWKVLKNQLLANVKMNESSSISEALEKLRNNEHIDFALQTGIISTAVVFSFISMGVCKDYANSKICYIDPYCNDDACQIELFDKVIEKDELLFKLKQVNRFIPGFFDADRIHEKYILDIDLDCFHTIKSINPINISVFNDLVNNAELITIATEASYVEMEKKDNDVNADYLLEKLLMHIENATMY